MKRVAFLLALLILSPMVALARGGAHRDAAGARAGNPAYGGPWPSSTAVGGTPSTSAPFNPSGVGVPGGSGPGNTLSAPNMAPPPVNTGPTGPGGTFGWPGSR